MRCSKSEPCSNCQRAGTDCIYDEPPRENVKVPKSTAALAERVAELEVLVANMKQQLATQEEGTARSSGSPAPTSRGNSVFAAENIAKRILSEMSQPPASSMAITQGRLVSDDVASRHLMNSFWASMYDEVGVLPNPISSCAES